MAISPAHKDALVGSLLGKDYLVLEQIGMGGMAVVYLVEHQTLKKRFAAKVLSPEHASSEEAHARFAQEAKSASQLDHENIVTISDFGVTQDDRPYFVMELLRGQTLDVRLEQGPMSIEEVVAVSVPVARALAHAHAEGIIHRDVKPENVFLVQRSQGRWGVKVLDFGIAKVQVNQQLTAMGQALGSPMFMSPEACRGEDVDQRADIYSFGILLYLMFAGRVPFADESLLKILQMQVTMPLPSPRLYNPDLSPEIEAVVVRALEKNPDDRYPSMDALLLDLEAVLPEGSDALLILAQHGTSSLQSTPFPGTLDRVRQSQRNLRVSQMNVAGVSQLNAPERSTGSRAVVLPPAPKKSGRGTLVAVGTIGVLAIAGMCGYLYWLRETEKQEVAQQAVAPAQKAIAPAEPPAAVEPPAPVEPVEPPPRVVGPPVVEPAVTEEPPVVEEPRTPATKKVAAAKKQPPAKPVQKAVPPPKPGSAAAKAGSAATKPGETGSATPPSGSATVAVAQPTPEKPTPPPVTVPTPPVVKPAVVPPTGPGSLDATPAIASLDVNGPLPSSTVKRAVERALPAMRTCYRTAAKAAGKTPADKVTLSFEIDENSTATGVAASGASLGTLAACAKGAIARIQTQQAPDVGTVHVVVAITFRPI
jgi:serine/threonine-protein kinase